MNKVILIGRLTKEVEAKTSANGNAFCHVPIAVDRDFTNKEGKREADFFSISFFRKNAETMQKYARKGARIAIEGVLRNRPYTVDGVNKTVTEVICDKVKIIDWPENSTSTPATKKESSSKAASPKAAPVNTAPTAQPEESLEEIYGDIDLETFF